MEKNNMESLKGDLSPKAGAIFLVLMVFFGSFLLFWMEPLIGRLLTPRFGGAVHVWLVCLMFFQGMLLIGYLYAHLLANRFWKYHLALLLIPLVNFPLNVYYHFDSSSPLWEVLGILFLNAALPFAVLSTTAVVAQSWLARSQAGKFYEPYPLYAASNAGALVALIGYTFLAEPLMELRSLRLAWSWTYALYGIIVVGAWFLLRPRQEIETREPDKNQNPGAQTIPDSSYAEWLVLSSLPSAFLLAVTNLITLEIGSFPLIWVIPLALYLTSFIVTFRTGGGAPRFLKLLWPEILFLAFFLYTPTFTNSLIYIGILTVFFTICILCHGYLYELRPPAEFLTKYYLLISLGGLIGGIFISVIAPLIFIGLFEYPILLALFAVAFWYLREDGFIQFWPKASWWAKGGRVLVMGVLIFFIAKGSWTNLQYMTVYRHRNFYGTYRITDYAINLNGSPSAMRFLIHGMTIHGAQLLDPGLRLTPMMYYQKGWAIADVFDSIESPRRIAIIGLGSGVTAAYARENDTFTYYEIDDDNEKIARQFFTFLDESKGKTQVVVGDGRYSLQKTADSNQYDLIFVDAFSGDGIPTNLVTREALGVYLRRLAENGIVLFHVSNRYYELQPVINSIAREMQLFAVQSNPISDQEDFLMAKNRVKCVAISRAPERLAPLLEKGWIADGKGGSSEKVSPWTDEYINIFSPLIEKIRHEWGEKNGEPAQTRP
ncbi:MAG: hypothetical protein H6Q42_3355 [Deltaproteobacteria bacterium]|nr:hypothetical protein [Deltaproteobacteria bacterium]